MTSTLLSFIFIEKNTYKFNAYEKQKSNFIKLGIFLFGISFLLFNCEKEELEIIDVKTKKELNIKTVSPEKAKLIFENYLKNKSNTFARGESDELTLDPQWETTAQDSLNFTEALLTNTETIINREGNYTSKVFFLEVNDSIVSAIHSIFPETTFDDGNLKDGNIYFNDFEGNFLDAYKVTNGKISHKLIPKENVQQANLFSFIHFFFQSGSACWSEDTLDEFDDGVLDEVVITVSGNGSGSTSSAGQNAYYLFLGDSNSYDDENSDTDSNNNSGGSNGGTGDNENSSPNCTGGKVLNTTTNQCECPADKVEDSNGNCIDKPCDGDPIKTLEIAKQNGLSGKKGALYGCTRYGGSCTGTGGRNENHRGIDLKNNYGSPIYAMYDGFVFSTKYDKNGAGYYTRIQSTVNGETILTEYFHLQKDNRVLQGNPLVNVKAGDIIGYQGDSGNLKGAIVKKSVESHVHIEVRKHNGGSSWGYANFNTVDPRTYFKTTINNDGTTVTNTDCN